MTLTQDIRTRRRHRGLTPWQLVQKIGRLEREADKRDCQLMGLATENAELREDRNRIQREFDTAAIDLSGALEDLRIADEENARLRAELANRDAVTVPPMERDTSDGADQATAPVGIDVKPLWDALGVGPVAQASTDDAELPEDHPDYVPNPPYDLPEGDWR